jgi:hypothetical protein
MGYSVHTHRVLLVLACCGLTSLAAHAFDAPPRQRPAMQLSDTTLPPLYLKSHIVNAEIRGRVARVVTESVYHNDTSQQLEATYVFPLPDDAAVERFVMWMDGKPVEAQVGEKDSARRTYEQIVARKKDPGLVEQVSAGVFKMRIFPVMPGSDQKVRLEYSQVLPLSSNGTVVTYDYPLAAPQEKNAREVVAANFVVSVSMEMEAQIASIESPSHQISQHIKPDEPAKARASIESAHTALDRDFSLKISLKNKALPLSSLAYRPAPKDGIGEEGTLMLLFTPELIAGEELPPKDVVMVMDVSGSMQGEKIQQARGALEVCLKRLRPADRFAIESFSDDVTTFQNDWCDATAANIENALRFVSGLNAGGSTNIEEAIRRALAYKGQPGRVRQILFATDGCPTVGSTDINLLATQASKKDGNNPEGVDTRFFTFGIGYDVNTVLLDKMAALTRGDRAYVRPEEDIARKVGDLCDKIAAPVLTDVTVTFSNNLNVQHVYPPQTGDLYMGRQTVLTARYTTPGTGTVTLRGKRGGKDVVIEAPLTLPETSAQATAYLPRQWAIRKVGFLLDQIHLNGEQPEMKDEVIRLGKTYGIVTPYTSYLALEPEHQPQQPRTVGAARTPPVSTRQSLMSEHHSPPADPIAHEEMSVADTVAAASKQPIFGDHSERINPDIEELHSSFGNADANMFHSVAGSEQAGGGGVGGVTVEDTLNAGGSVATGTGGGWGGGIGTGTGVASGSGAGSFGNRGGGGRALMVKRHGGSRATESSVETALRWMAYHQETDGHWDAKKFGAATNSNIATTSLALLALLGSGHTEKIGTYKDNVKGAVAWLIANQAKEGTIGGGDTLTDQHLLATLALAEAAGMGNIPETRKHAQLAVDYMIIKDPEFLNAQLYNVQWESTRVYSAAWFVMAAKSAKVAALTVPASAFESALKFLDACEQKDAGGIVRYINTKGAQPSPLATAAGLLCRQWTGTPADALHESVAALINEGGVPAWATLDPHYCYLATLSAFQQGGENWKVWNAAEKTALTDNQDKTKSDDEGSWNMTSTAAAPLGRVSQTALACLCLETYYRYQQLNPGDYRNRPAAASGNAVATPAATPVPAMNSKADSGREGVDYSEYIRQLKEGVEPGK